MAISFLTNLNEEEFKIFLKQALIEILGANIGNLQPDLPDVLDATQASNFLHIKISTLYEKTSEKTIPHFKRGNKLYFRRGELQAWVEAGKVTTQDALESQAATYIMQKEFKKVKTKKS